MIHFGLAEGSVHIIKQLPALCICQICLISVSREAGCQLMQRNKRMCIDCLVESLHHFRFVIDLIVNGQSLVEPGRGINALCRELVKDERSEEHTSELQSLTNLVCRLL